MDGQKVFKFSYREVPKAFNELLTKAELKQEAIDLFIFHQASAVILRKLKSKLNIPDDKWFQNIKSIGNTVSATIPIALKQAKGQWAIKTKYEYHVNGFWSRSFYSRVHCSLINFFLTNTTLYWFQSL